MIRIEFWGDYALFTRPEMKVERVSYDVPTPSAARGMIESIYYHPGIRWIIDRIYVLSPIEFTNVRRNEIKSKLSHTKARAAMQGGTEDLRLIAEEERVQRAAMMLKNVHYVIEAHFELTDKANSSDNPGKVQDIIKRRLSRGSCYSQPYFGTRECTAYFAEWTEKTIPTIDETRDLGWMLYDMDFSCAKGSITPMFFQARMKNGIIDVSDCEVVR